MPLLRTRFFLIAFATTLILSITSYGSAVQLAEEAMKPDKINYDPVQSVADYIRREVMVPMRDGTRLFTVIVHKKGVENAPIMLSRTPYDSRSITWRIPSQRVGDILPKADREFVEDGYIRVYQDVRGQDASEGDYVLVRPARGPLNKSGIDHSTDAFDTISWLVEHLPNSNGKVAIQGSSYLGFTALMALLDPHPALKAVVSMSPMVDGWRGDDWFHNGAFRQSSFGFVLYQMSDVKGGSIPFGDIDQYDAYLQSGSASAFAKRYGLDAFPAIQKMFRHPSYDEYWRLQAVDQLLGSASISVPTMLVMSQWDQEDNYGAPAVYKILEEMDRENDNVFFGLGPWRHSGVLHDGSSLGPLTFDHDTALHFRTAVIKPFLDRLLREVPGTEEQVAPVTTFDTGQGRWQRSPSWPVGTFEPIYLTGQTALSWERPEASKRRYTSDPDNPVPFSPRPIDMSDAAQWRTWRIRDQRFVEGRDDVLVYRSPPLKNQLQIAGAPRASIFAKTSGTDSDWVVKLIDQAPNGSQVMLGVEIFRGRYVDSFASPRALIPGSIEHYEFGLPTIHHTLSEGHRLVVHVQSSLFPLYDRNPQSFVPNIFFAKPEEYERTTQTLMAGGAHASALYLPLVDAEAP